MTPRQQELIALREKIQEELDGIYAEQVKHEAALCVGKAYKERGKDIYLYVLSHDDRGYIHYWEFSCNDRGPVDFINFNTPKYGAIKREFFDEIHPFEFYAAWKQFLENLTSRGDVLWNQMK